MSEGDVPVGDLTGETITGKQSAAKPFANELLTQPRQSWDLTWMRVAMVVGARSRCSLAQVGAVIVTPDNQVVAASYNGPARGLEYEGSCMNWCPRAMQAHDKGTSPAYSPDYGNCESVHAEANAIARADWIRAQGGTIYVTASSCINCMRLIANAGLRRVVHRVVSESDLRRDPGRTEEYARKAGLETSRWVKE